MGARELKVRRLNCASPKEGKECFGPVCATCQVAVLALSLCVLPFSLFSSLSPIHGPGSNNGPTSLSTRDATVRKTKCPLWIYQHLKIPRLSQLRVCSPPPNRQPLLFLRFFPQANKTRRRRGSPRRFPQEWLKWHTQQCPPSSERQRAHQTQGQGERKTRAQPRH